MPRALYAAFDRFPSRKGAAIHIDRFARTLFQAFDGGVLCVLGGEDLPKHQIEPLPPQSGGQAILPVPSPAHEGDRQDCLSSTLSTVHILRFAEEIPNFLDRALAYGAWLAHTVDTFADTLQLCHFRDPWSGGPIALRPHRYRTVYEVNALPSIELPSLFPGLTPRTLEKIRQIELDCCAAADRIVTPSHTTASLLTTLGVHPEKIHVIPNGADLDEPAPRPDNAPDRYILYFGAAQSWQGLDTLLRAFARLADFEDLRLVFCASRDSSAWRAVARFAERLGVHDRIVWNFALDEPELARWRQHALLSVAPLTDSERNVVQGCAPLKILESMASGTAVVASNVPPVRELVDDRENGWLVHPERPAELARAIRILLEHPERARALGAAARRTIAERFTWERSVSALHALYAGVMEKGAEAHGCLSDLSIPQR